MITKSIAKITKIICYYSIETVNKWKTQKFKINFFIITKNNKCFFLVFSIFYHVIVIQSTS